MRFAVSLLAVIAGTAAPRAGVAPPRPPIHHYQIASTDPGPWPRILGSIGLHAAGAASCAAHPCVFVVPAGAEAPSEERFRELVERGSLLILEGHSPLARTFGILAGEGKPVPVRGVMDIHDASLDIVWEKPLDIAPATLPSHAQVFVRDRWTKAPLAAGIARGAGGVVWLAASPGTLGYERYPYLPRMLTAMGLRPPVKSRDLWAFFDSSYRLRADLDYLALRWRDAGIAALHVASWHYFEPDPVRDDYLRRLIEACHRRGILVYAWIEFPHVSAKFWDDHPEWREQTALLQDAQLDWRKLMNLRNPDCARAAAEGLDRLAGRFDWDGVNLAELYFESLEGHANAARFTPMNPNVRREFEQLHGSDPRALFQGSPDPATLRLFLDYRAGLAHSLQEEWIGEIEKLRAKQPHLDLVLTHVDDRYDTRMRDLIGADASRLLPLLNRHDFTFLIEDPATLWHLGPERYPGIAEKYRPITPRPGKLAIDINIVSRYQDVYPTKQQTGSELFQLVHMASEAFPRVALYFENSILPADLELLPAAAASVEKLDRAGPGGSRLAVQCRKLTGIPWNGPALVNGKPWPFRDETHVWLPAGAWSIESAATAPSLQMTGFAGTVTSVWAAGGSLEIAYRSSSRAFAYLNRAPAPAADIDGQSAKVEARHEGDTWVVPLPRGQHVVTLSLPSR